MTTAGNFLRGTLGIVIGLVTISLSIILGFALIKGGVSIGVKIFPFVSKVAMWNILVTVVILLPLSFIPFSYKFSAIGLFISAAIFAFSTWLWAGLVTYELWGAIALFIGVLVIGVGVLPIAILATAVNGMWSQCGQIILMIVIVFITTTYANYVNTKANRRH